MRTVVAAVCVLVGLAGAVTATLPDRAALEKVPAEVRQAADRAAPGVEWHSACEYTPRRKPVVTYFVLRGQEKAGKEREVSFTCRADGSGGRVVVEVDVEDVPQSVSAALKAAAPTFAASAAQLVGPSVAAASYRVSGRQGKGQAVYVVSQDGKQVSRE